MRDGEIVVHVADGRMTCDRRDHGVVDSTVPAGNTFDSVERPDWIGVVWRGGEKRRHPSANLHPCSCDVP